MSSSGLTVPAGPYPYYIQKVRRHPWTLLHGYLQRPGDAPKAVREARGIRQGDEVVFRVERRRAVLARTPHFLALAGTLVVPAAARRNAAWDEVVRKARSSRAATKLP
jgi:hypothetical protein